MTPLLMACQMGYRGIVKLLLKKGAKIDQGNAHQGVTPLIMAAYSDRPEILQVLIEHGADINKGDYDGDTALFSAIARKNPDCVELLLKPQYKCDVQIRNKKDLNAVEYAIVKSTSEVCTLVLNSESFQPSQTDRSGFNALHTAAKKGNARAVAIILQKAPNIVNNKKDDGWTALHLAAGNDNYETIVLILSQKHCDINARSNAGATPLHTAVTNGYVRIVEKLLEKGADMNAQDKDGDTSLHLACMLINRPSLMQQLESDGDAEKKKTDNIAIAVVLVQKGAKVDIENQSEKLLLIS
ncbi:uncharacterized protein [Amphiura filiformis]|uniref:uncharacterized protein n=1 Tax=Amphiura filiformis TaxID=82378 RepID=UPI003B222FB6